MKQTERPTLLVSMIPIVLLITLIFLLSRLFSGDITSGPAQVALITAGVVAAIIAIAKYKVPWEKLEGAMLDNLRDTGGALFILLMIGALTATWVQSGVVPSLIYFGLKLINPSAFLIVTFLFTAAISLMLGSSWTTIGTIGIALLSAGQILGLHSGWVAGAIISGAYFGDKLSPLSDTNNLAATIAGVKLYDNVKYLLITNIPTVIITAIVFTIVGMNVSASAHIDVQGQIQAIKGTYNVSIWLLLIPAFTIFLMVRKVSPFLTLFLSAVFAAVISCIAQPQIISQISPFGPGDWRTYLYAPVKMMSSHVDITAPNAMLTKLASTNGIGGMLNTIWLIMCVTIFGGIIDAAGYIGTITAKMDKMIRNTTSLVATTMGTCLFCNLTLSDQYMAIVVPGKMLRQLYKEKGYETRLLSRSIGDSATVFSVLIPWNTCGAMQSGVLGIPTLAYAPYCILNFISPISSLVIAAIGFRIFRWGKPLLKWHSGKAMESADKPESKDLPADAAGQQ